MRVKICPACSSEYPPERSHCERDGVQLVALTTGSSQDPQDLVGRVVDGRYQVEAIIGKGGMGTVYACRHVVVGKPFAMKVLRQGVEQTEGVLQRFIREAQTANSVRSRHIVEMTDFGQLPSGQFYVTMELLEGLDLGKALKRGLSRPELLHVFIQCADVLALTHQRGIVHRDLKPDNIFLVNEEGDPLFVKLLDFGIAKAMHSGPSGLTETGVVLGTPYYMSPEQARGEEVDHRTDIYSLGVIMYRAFTGRLPFVADSAVGVLTRHLTEAPAPPSRVAGTDSDAERIILCCLEKRREARFQSMQNISEALRALAGPMYQGTRSGAVPAASLPSGAYTSATASVHRGSMATGGYGGAGASGSYPSGGPSGSYPAGAPSGSHATAYLQGQSGGHPATSSTGYGAAVPNASGSYGAAVPNASGSYGAAVPNASGSYGAAVPNASGSYGAAVPNASGGYGAAVPNASGSYGAAPNAGSGATPRTLVSGSYGPGNAAPTASGAFNAANAANAPSTISGVFAPTEIASLPIPLAAYTNGQASVHNTGRPYADGALPELTSHGLATSQGLKIPQPQRRWPLIVGAMAMLGLGGVIAVSLGAWRGAGNQNAGGAVTTAPLTSSEPALTQTPSASAPAEAPSGTPAPSPSATSSASATAGPQASAPSPSGSASSGTKQSGKVPATPTAKTAATSTKRAPEIRSPFD